ncbi:MAG: tryptophan synthase subunit alpha [Bacteroidota bacterium]
MGQILKVKNRIDKVFEDKTKLLNVYFTAGYPELGDTIRVAKALEKAGADLLEIGMPFSDPLADGPTIQESSQRALDNGMTLHKLFEQLADLRNQIQIPVLLMGYINPVLQFGLERFCKACSEVGIDGVILPDLPIQEYIEQYKSQFQELNLHNIFLISPTTSDERIRLIDDHSGGFIYVVSSSSITGAKKSMQNTQIHYFNRVANMGLRHPRLIGFGISDNKTFESACQYAEGAIIGSAFIDQLKVDSSDQAIEKFVATIKKST